MAGTTRLELATSAVTGRYPGGGLSGFSGLPVFLVAHSGYSGHGWHGIVQRFVQQKNSPFLKPYGVRVEHALHRSRVGFFGVAGKFLRGMGKTCRAGKGNSDGSVLLDSGALGFESR